MAKKLEHDIIHWFDFVCPFCYISQEDNEALIAQGWTVTELGFSAHPEIPEGGVFIGPRSGGMYDMIEAEAERQGLALNWQDRVPSARLALSAAEYVRHSAPEQSDLFRSSVFSAHFAERRDIGSRAVVLAIAEACGVSLPDLLDGLDSGKAAALLEDARRLGRQYGVSGTPAWYAAGHLIMGRQPGGLARQLGSPGS